MFFTFGIVCLTKGGKYINQVILIGRLTKNPEIVKKGDIEYCKITVATKRQFKNPDGIYETDFITCTVWNVIAEKICDFCKKGDLISIRGRIQNNNYVDKDSKKIFTYDVIAEQVSFMQTKYNDSLEDSNILEEN